ncbi:MAG: bifunctional (p)ppGpp synthetase/guanosine-3',5'-bis(diphosphate) 3'-pyrophosphohydrolase [Erysipelotrichaceae bacterium]|nr:bifunctional (p)ppGpp synthetase/guanosine-3',5'-bis(diphosphate) 3'-pyrophosphohydrolase [Erysipelotrichaceae bacterium]MDY6034478.1 bifunctional (p)ppGpp synthetase/guanosine-3',5'-bis(diphosphate) 3'-pyrophosphohydrolase [Bulleidia sp.]
MAERKNPSVDDVMNEARTYIHDPNSLALIERAASYAAGKHAGMFRKSGDPYFVHLINVAYILATLRVGPTTISAGFLHDVIEDCNVTREELAEEFTDEIASLVEAVTKIGNLNFKGKDDPEYQAANHRKIFIAMAKDIRVIIIKLVDRLHNMRTLDFQPEASQKRIAAETLDVYAPIAHRLGISAIKNELEDLCFYYLMPEEYYHIAHLVETKKAERDASVNKMIADISTILTKHNIKFRIFGRSKHLYSIYKKMVNKHKRFDEILDLLAIRIITKTELNCYETLGYIHAIYKPIPGRLKDYIAVPKPNMYQSLHTTILGEDARIFEVQIRTEDMDAIAERGIAAHWRYKEGTRYDAKVEQKEIEDKLSWFKDFATYSETEANTSATDYMELLQKDVFEANVYVMTPKGRVIDLPAGATPIDFAYRIHTDVGHTMVGAIVNDAIVPLNTELHTGDVVNIKTLKGTGPSEDWLKIVKTAQARNKIRAYFLKKESEKREEKIAEGEKSLTDELRKRGFDPKEYMERKKIDNITSGFQVSNYNELMYGIAVKSINVGLCAERLTNVKQRVSEDETLSRVLNKETVHRVSKSGLVIPGIDSMKMSLAHCCLPVYGDEIIGYITRSEGVKVHRTDCPNIKNEKSKLIKVHWDEGDADRLYDCDLSIISNDRPHLLTDIVNTISQCKVQLESINTNVNHETLTSTVKVSIRLRNIEQMDNVIANIRKVESVLSVDRTTH